MSSESEPITVLLKRIRQGSDGAKDELVALLYERFRRWAHGLLKDRPGHTMRSGDLTNEALRRLVRYDEIEKAANRGQLYFAVRRAMRQALCDYDRKHKDRPRRAEMEDDPEDGGPRLGLEDVLSLYEGLDALAAERPRAAEVLKLRFFGGCGTAEIAEALAVDPRTVQREAKVGLAWLYRRLSPAGTA